MFDMGTPKYVTNNFKYVKQKVNVVSKFDACNVGLPNKDVFDKTPYKIIAKQNAFKYNNVYKCLNDDPNIIYIDINDTVTQKACVTNLFAQVNLHFTFDSSGNLEIQNLNPTKKDLGIETLDKLKSLLTQQTDTNHVIEQSQLNSENGRPYPKRSKRIIIIDKLKELEKQIEFIRDTIIPLHFNCKRLGDAGQYMWCVDNSGQHSGQHSEQNPILFYTEDRLCFLGALLNGSPHVAYTKEIGKKRKIGSTFYFEKQTESENTNEMNTTEEIETPQTVDENTNYEIMQQSIYTIIKNDIKPTQEGGFVLRNTRTPTRTVNSLLKQTTVNINAKPGKSNPVATTKYRESNTKIQGLTNRNTRIQQMERHINTLITNDINELKTDYTTYTPLLLPLMIDDVFYVFDTYYNFIPEDYKGLFINPEEWIYNNTTISKSDEDTKKIQKKIQKKINKILNQNENKIIKDFTNEFIKFQSEIQLNVTESETLAGGDYRTKKVKVKKVNKKKKIKSTKKKHIISKNEKTVKMKKMKKINNPKTKKRHD
jgi:hypothetical protein